MDLQVYIKEQRKVLDKFEADWEKRALRDPGLYPTKLSKEDWDDQFQAWCARRAWENLQEEKSE